MKTSRIMPGKVFRNRGFTLIEMAIVLMIVGFLLSGLLVSLTQSAENTRRTNASTQLQRIEEALYAFAQTTGRLPCPASNTSFGLEVLAESPPAIEAICGIPTTVHHGFVPSATLGLTGPVNGDGLLIDPWGNPYRYSVADQTEDLMAGSPRVFTSTDNLKSRFATLTGPLDSNGMLTVCSALPCAPDGATSITSVAPAVVLSMGPNWATFTSAEEVSNAGNVPVGIYLVTNTDVFVSTTYNEDNFDDLIVWLSPNVLFSRMISAGRLP